MKRIFYTLLMLACCFAANSQVTFDFANAPAAGSPVGYAQPAVGTYYKATGGGTITFGSATCDGYSISAPTGSSLFIFVATQDLTSITVRGTGTGNNRTFSSMTTSATLNGTYVAAGAGSTGAIGSPSSANCGAIVITPTVPVTAGTYMKLTFSGNLNVTSILYTPAAVAAPTVQASGINFTGVSATGMTVNWTNGDGSTRAVFVKQAAGAITNPVDGTTYTASANWNNGAPSGTQLGSSGYYCVYNGTGNNVALINMSPSTLYYVQVFEYNGVGSFTKYLTTTAANNPNNQATAAASPTITVSKTTMDFAYVKQSTSSAEQTYTVSAVFLTPAAGNITVNAPASYEVSTTTGTGFGPSVTLPYTASTLANTTIYVRFNPTATTSYTGNIGNSGGGAPVKNIALTGNGSLSASVAIGDYGSVGSANWNVNANWMKWDGSGWNTSAGASPAATDNVWVLPGTTVNIDASAKTCNNIFVYGNLTSSSQVNSPFYLRVSGAFFEVNTGGFVGSSVNPTGDNADGISIDDFSNGLTITGTGGSIYLSRLRPNNAASTITVDHDLTLNYHGSTNQGGHVAAFYPAAGDGSSMTINAGKTLTFAPWACLTTTSSSNGYPSLSFTLNVNGNLLLQNSPAPNATVQGINSYIYGGEASGKTFTMNIGSTGVVTTPEFYPNGTISSGGVGTGTVSSLNIAAGGVMNITNIGDFRLSTQTVTGAGTFNLTSGAKLRIGSASGITAAAAAGPIQTTARNFSTAGLYEYDSTATVQVTGDGLPATVAALFINNNTSTTTLTNNVAVTDSIKLQAGKLVLGTKNATAGSVKGGASTAYIVTDASGKLKINNVGASNILFPVGPSTTGYNPVTINNGGIPDNLSVSVKTTIDNPPSDPTKVVNMQWSITEDVAGGSNATVTPQWNSAAPGTGDEAAAFNRAAAVVIGHYVGVGWDEISATVAGANPYTASAGGITSFSPFIVGNLHAVPLTLLSFNATLNAGMAKLFWNTSNEINVKNYSIERSGDAISFSSIGSVNANNTATTSNYSFNDATAVSGIAYYRLKMIDRDGKYKYSSVIALNAKKATVLSVFPNPAKEDVFVTHGKAVAGASIELYAMDGRKLMGEPVAKDAMQTTVHTAALPAGVYQLVYTNGDAVQKTRLIKQ